MHSQPHKILFGSPVNEKSLSFLEVGEQFFMVFNDHLLRAFLVSLTYSAQFHIIHLGVAVDEEDMSGPWEWEMGEAQLW